MPYRFTGGRIEADPTFCSGIEVASKIRTVFSFRSAVYYAPQEAQVTQFFVQNQVPNHQTVRLAEYDPQWQHLALDLFQRVSTRVNPAQLAQPQPLGSYSILRSGGSERAAKIVLYEARLAKGSWKPGADGVYVCLRTKGHSATASLTVGFLPNQDEHFAFFRLEPTQDLDAIADFIVASADY